MSRFDPYDEVDSLDGMDEALSLQGWLESLDDREFDHMWVGAVMSAIVEDGIAVSELAGVMNMCRNRMRSKTLPDWVVRLIIQQEGMEATGYNTKLCRGIRARM